MTGPTLSDVQRDGLRLVLLRAMHHWSEENYNADWWFGLERILWQDEEFRAVGQMLGEWPTRNYDPAGPEHLWVSLADWEAKQ